LDNTHHSRATSPHTSTTRWTLSPRTTESPVDALAAGERDERDHGPVDRVGVEVVVGAGAHDDHRPPLRTAGVVGELPADADDRVDRHAGVLGGPRRGARLGRVLVAGGPLPGRAGR